LVKQSLLTEGVVAMRRYLVQDAEGRYVGIVSSGVQRTTLSESGPSGATVPSGADDTAELTFGAVPLPGQTFHEVDLPREIEQLQGAELFEALMSYELEPGKRKLVLRGRP
jgi:hypothetical protein